MASISVLLTLPQTSRGLAELKHTVSQTYLNDTGSASPRRKVPRLDTDSDSASASRSQATIAQKLVPGLKKSGSVTIHFDGHGFVSKPASGDKELSLLRRCIRVILNPDEAELMPATHQTIYSACRTVVSIAKRGDGLYNVLQMELERYVNVLVKECTRKGRGPVEWIGLFVSTCTSFETRVDLLVSLLAYLDQDYIVKNSPLKPIRSTANTILRELVFGNPTVLENIYEGTKDWIESERNSKAAHLFRAEIPRLINLLVSHGQYEKFERYYVSLTYDYYSSESERLSKEQQKDPRSFFEHVQARIKQEIERNKETLPVGSWGLLRETTERALWNNKLDWLANETVGTYIEEGDITPLQTMYNLFGRVDGLKTLCSAFRKYVATSVVDIVGDTEHDEEMVDRLLKLRHLAINTTDQAFLMKASTTTTNSTSSPPQCPDQMFSNALRSAFTMGFKARRSKPAEMIAKYLDKAMRKGQGESTDTDFDTTLTNVLELYRFSEDKDVFRTFYHRSLAKRLLLGKSASNDFEIGMLKKMKEKYDPEFGMGEDMFKDLALSKENMADYHSKLGDDNPDRKLNVMVLQRSAWPFRGNDSVPDETSQDDAKKKTSSKDNRYFKDIDLPLGMQKQLTRFSKYYQGKHSGRKLDWNHGLGTAILKARFATSVKELSVSLFQAVVLLLFNELPEVSFQDIKAHVQMNDAELRRTLQSLACGKKKVLKKVPPGRDVDDDDVFRFNADFMDPRSKIHINSIQAKVSLEESQKTNAAIEGDRKMYLDAAIVRIMKANKTMTYEKIKTATIEAVKSHFAPQVELIKQRVDYLVEAEYLERDRAERNKFHYVA